jgi:hypothetical protein
MLPASQLPELQDVLSKGHEVWNRWEQNRDGLYPLDLPAVLGTTAIPLSFTGYHFAGPVIFDGVKFPGDVTFAGADFEHEPSFVDTRFTGRADFSGTRFVRGVRFLRSRFHGDALFNAAEFRDHAHFRYTRFYAEANFDRCTVANGTEFDLIRSVIKKHFSFSHTTWPGGASYALTLFCWHTDFRNSSFTVYAIFDDCVFRADAGFENVVFNDGSFQKTVFARDADFSTEGAHFLKEANFAHARFEGTAKFSRRRFNGITVFRWAHFEEPPEFFNTELPNETDFEHATYGPITRANAVVAEPAYRTLKLKMSELQHHRAEMMFFAKEMRARRFNEPNTFLRTLYRLYGLFSDFGESVVRPAIGWMVVGLIFFFLYSIATEGRTLRACLPDLACTFKIGRFLKRLELTGAGLIPFFDVTKQLTNHALVGLVGVNRSPGYILVLQVLELIGSLLFLFLLGLGIRNLFRLK